MDTKTLTELDYYRLREKIASYCKSQEGGAELLSREPYSNPAQYESLKNLSREWAVCFSSARDISLKAWPFVQELFSVIKTKGARLEVAELYALGLFCQNARDAKEKIAGSKDELGLKNLDALAQKIPDLSAAEAEIFRIVDKDGSLKDLRELRDIKSEIQALRRDIEGAFKKIVSDPSLARSLESTLPVVRSDRQVLAVKSSERSKIKGIVHELSNSGQTVFIEPEEAVRLNNDLVQKEFELESAIRKILAQATEKLCESAAAFEETLPLMVRLDTTQAAARWGMENACSYALSAKEDEAPLLLEARHPLLKDKAVPIDIKFMDAKKVLIITGANTGGKTVAIKTFALFSLLNQSGFPIPAAEGSRLPCFDAVFADIGDEQSIDASLSTFSAHMKNIALALSQATDKSLVLLDELGSGTDPLEGSAIAMAALDELIERGSFVLVTTHHGVLKNYGWTNPVCCNASVEFDMDALRPTYRLVMGIPGESHALEIADRSGMEKAVVQKARGYIQSQAADVSALIKGLNQKHLELDRLLKETADREERLQDVAFKNEEKEIKLRRREHDFKAAQGKEEAAFLRESRRKLENLIRELKEGEITREKTLAAKQFKEELAAAEKVHADILQAEEANLLRDEEKFEKKKNSHKSNKPSKAKTKNSEALKTATPTLAPRKVLEEAAPVFAEGAKVHSIATGAEGVLLRKEKNDEWLVQFGALKIKARQKDLRLDASAQGRGAAQKIPSWQYLSAGSVGGPKIAGAAGSVERPAYELRLLGMRADEAVRALEKQIDLCVLNGLDHFSVIHGKGTGALQKAVQDYLKAAPAVGEYSFAPAEDGGAGKTYVKLK
ncbi:MAG: Smr/MutS family protein [Treponema sp.]|nr:Smr/MutS family protein [Treponema sp.]